MIFQFSGHWKFCRVLDTLTLFSPFDGVEKKHFFPSLLLAIVFNHFINFDVSLNSMRSVEAKCKLWNRLGVHTLPSHPHSSLSCALCPFEGLICCKLMYKKIDDI